jgi:acetyltransferase-like isoleucine patch superfamily enzyme
LTLQKPAPAPRSGYIAILATRVAGIIGKFFPILGWLSNKFRFPSLHCGMHVEIIDTGNLLHGSGVRIGAYSRIYLDDGGSLFLGNNVGLGRDVHIQTSSVVRIGARTGMNDGARISGSVEIGRHCAIGPNLNVSSGMHLFRSAEPWKLIAVQERENGLEDRPVTIGDDCWIGAHVVIMRGITIGRGAVVGANAVVTGDVSAYTVVAGVPARRISERMAFKPPVTIDAERPEDMPYFYSGFEQMGRQGDGYPCDKRFSVALDAGKDPGSTIELRIISVSGGKMSHGAEQKTFAAGASALRFPADAAVPIFQEFHCEGDCRILSASIIEPEHKGRNQSARGSSPKRARRKS